LARVSHLESTRAKARLTPDQTVQFYTAKLTHFAPGLTLVGLLMTEIGGVHRISCSFNDNY